MQSEDPLYNYGKINSASLTFRLDENNVKKLRIEAQKQGVSLNSRKSCAENLS
jgi:predicted HicB family RNase H-like nuclease